MNIEFQKDSHSYTVNGIPTVSVTKIVGDIFPKKYSGIPEDILRRAAEYGTSVHELLERYITKREIGDKMELILKGINYDLLETQFNIKPIELEQMVAYMDGEIPLYVGRYDMTANVNDEITLIDFKTTSKCDKDSLSWQLSMYAMALEQVNNTKIDKLACLWFPKTEIGQFIYVDRLDDEIVLSKVKEILGV